MVLASGRSHANHRATRAATHSSSHLVRGRAGTLRRPIPYLLAAASWARHARAALVDRRVDAAREVLRLAGNAAQICLRDPALYVFVVDGGPLALLTRDVSAGSSTLHAADRVAR